MGLVPNLPHQFKGVDGRVTHLFCVGEQDHEASMAIYCVVVAG